MKAGRNKVNKSRAQIINSHKNLKRVSNIGMTLRIKESVNLETYLKNCAITFFRKVAVSSCLQQLNFRYCITENRNTLNF